MSPAVGWLIAELVKLGLNHVALQGKFNTLTQDEAEDTYKAIANALPTVLPTPEDLEKV